MRRLLFALPILLVASLGLTSCETYPSGCFSLAEYELPDTYVWNAPSLAVRYYHDLPVQETFIGIAGSNPRQTYAKTWHGPAQFTGWAEYASAYRCWETGGGSSS